MLRNVGARVVQLFWLPSRAFFGFLFIGLLKVGFFTRQDCDLLREAIDLSVCDKEVASDLPCVPASRAEQPYQGAKDGGKFGGGYLH